LAPTNRLSSVDFPTLGLPTMAENTVFDCIYSTSSGT
jgi:hypothetical protein